MQDKPAGFGHLSQSDNAALERLADAAQTTPEKLASEFVAFSLRAMREAHVGFGGFKVDDAARSARRRG